MFLKMGTPQYVFSSLPEHVFFTLVHNLVPFFSIFYFLHNLAPFFSIFHYMGEKHISFFCPERRFSICVVFANLKNVSHRRVVGDSDEAAASVLLPE